MSEFDVSTSRGAYSVVIGPHLAPAVVDSADLVIVDAYVNEHVLTSRARSTISVPGSEATKTLIGCESILVRMNEFGARRGDTLVAVGGGAIQDVATLVASLYMRGIPWVYCPSTAMAMADSCIGGKSSINVGGIKNLVGNIYPPEKVVIDPLLAASLPVEARVSGLAEAVKICFAAGEESFDRYLALTMPPEAFGEASTTEALLDHVLRAKKWFIEVDEFDKKERQLLNFGHTYAHAFEAATDFAVPHGVAVAVGVLGALAHPSSARTSSSEALRQYCKGLLKPVQEPVCAAAAELDWATFERAVTTDKKGTRESLRLVLPARDGGVAVQAFARGDASMRAITESMADALAEVAA